MAYISKRPDKAQPPADDAAFEHWWRMRRFFGCGAGMKEDCRAAWNAALAHAKPIMNRPTYLGDSVFISQSHDACLSLFLNNGEIDEDHERLRKSEIILEPETAIALYAFLKKPLNL
jgi:hypothetical protein